MCGCLCLRSSKGAFGSNHVLRIYPHQMRALNVSEMHTLSKTKGPVGGSACEGKYPVQAATTTAEVQGVTAVLQHEGSPMHEKQQTPLCTAQLLRVLADGSRAGWRTHLTANAEEDEAGFAPQVWEEGQLFHLLNLKVLEKREGSPLADTTLINICDFTSLQLLTND